MESKCRKYNNWDVMTYDMDLKLFKFINTYEWIDLNTFPGQAPTLCKPDVCLYEKELVNLL